jgi:hypothetical protein
VVRFAALITASLAGATWAAAETIDVKYYGKLDLAPFVCTDVTRSSFINRACYDKSKQFMVVQLRSIYYPYCELPSATFETFLAAHRWGNTTTPTSKAPVRTVLLTAARTAPRLIKPSPSSSLQAIALQLRFYRVVGRLELCQQLRS